MASLGGVLGGIAASPFRLAGGAAKMAGRGAKAGLKATAFAAMDVTGALPLYAAAVGGVKAIGKGVKAGKNLLRPIGAPADGVTKDSAERAIAAAATETAKIDAETKKIEAETAQLEGQVPDKPSSIPGTSMGGIDVEILEKIYGEVVSIRGIIGGKDPESEKKELALDEDVRHRNFLKALAGLGFGGKGGDKEKKPWFDLGNLTEMFKGMLPAIIGGLGLAGLIAMWPKISSAFEGIADAISNINEFLDDMANFFSPLTDWLGGQDPAELAAGAGALMGTKTVTGRQARLDKEKMMKAADEERARKKQLKKEQDARRKKARQLLRDRKDAQNKAAQKRIAAHKAKLKAEKLAAAKRLMRGADADSMKGLKKFNLRAGMRTAAGKIGGAFGRGFGGLPEGFKLPVVKPVKAPVKGGAQSGGRQSGPVRPLGVKKLPAPPPVLDDARAKTKGFNLKAAAARIFGSSGQMSMGQGKLPIALPKPVVPPKTTSFSGDTAAGKGKVTPRTVLGSNVPISEVLKKTVPGTGVRRVPSPLEVATEAVPDKVKVSRVTPGAVIQDMLDKPVASRKPPVIKPLQYEMTGGPDRTKGRDAPQKGRGNRPYVNADTGKRMTSRYHFDERIGQWRDAGSKNARMGRLGDIVPENVAVDYLRKNGVEFKPEKGGFKELTTKQLRFMGEKPGLMGRIKGATRWAGSAGGLLSIVFIGWAIKNAFQQWQKDKPKGDMWPMNESNPADTAFRVSMAALAAAFGVGWIAAILSGMLGTMLAAPLGPGAPIVGFFAALLGGFAAGMAADQVTRWLQGEGVEESGTAGVVEGWKKMMEEQGGLGGALFEIGGGNMLKALPGAMMSGINKQREESKTKTVKYQLTTKEKQTLEARLLTAQKQEKKFSGRAAKKGKSAEYTAENKERAAAYRQEIQEIQTKLEADRFDTNESGGSLGGGTTLGAPTHKDLYGGKGNVNMQNVLGESSLTDTKLEDPTGGKAALDPNLRLNEYSGASLSNNLQTNPNIEGAALTQAGSNGGVLKADILVTNINNTTNSDSQQVSSTSSTSNVITFPNNPRSGSPMRSRFAV